MDRLKELQGFWAIDEIAFFCMYGPRPTSQFTEPNAAYKTLIHKEEW